MRFQAIGWLASAMSVGLASSFSRGAVQEFDFKDPKQVNAISFLLDSPLEPILGVATAVTGTVKFDPADPVATTGRLAVESKALHIENSKMKEVLHSADWMDVEKHPSIEFTFKRVKEVKTVEPNVFEMTAVGDFTCKGTTKELTIPLRATYLPDKLGERFPGMKGDLLVLRAAFTIRRADYGIKPDTSLQVVADEIQIRASIVGMSLKPSAAGK